MILNTERLRLRPLNPGDARAVHLMMSDAEVMAYWDVGRVEDPAVTGDIVQRQLAEAAADRAAHWAMERLSDRVFVGVCDLSEIDRRHARAEVGFMVGRAFWGEGYTFEAMHAVIAHAAQVLRLRRLQARTHIGNVRSIRLLERLGFKREGLMRGYVDRDGERRDCLLFGLLL
ncbi:MAG TPA: GNAT family N-acetyltransferase [Caulobacteraceae bacterium]|jgi:[ribosomal protein S5]-alanine N-acetyltransferase|nr:GNAT family N-acetyltransferase [Caulobacteraceae bacterium]